MRKLFLLLLIVSSVGYSQTQNFRRIKVDTLKSFTDSGFVVINDSVLIKRYLQGDSIGVPVTPPYGKGTLFIKGQGGIFYKKPNGSVTRLDSATTADSVAKAWLADSARISDTSRATYWATKVRSDSVRKADTSRVSWRADSLKGFEITGTASEIDVDQTGTNQHTISLPDDIGNISSIKGDVYLGLYSNTTNSSGIYLGEATETDTLILFKAGSKVYELGLSPLALYPYTNLGLDLGKATHKYDSAFVDHIVGVVDSSKSADTSRASYWSTKVRGDTVAYSYWATKLRPDSTRKSDTARASYWSTKVRSDSVQKADTSRASYWSTKVRSDSVRKADTSRATYRASVADSFNSANTLVANNAYVDTIYGGTTAYKSLFLGSTTNETPGNIYLSPNFLVDYGTTAEVYLDGKLMLGNRYTQTPFIWFYRPDSMIERSSYQDMGLVWYPESSSVYSYQVMQRVHHLGSDSSVHNHWSMYTKGANKTTDKKRINVPYGSDFVRFDFSNTSSFDIWRETAGISDTSKYKFGFTNDGDPEYKIYDRSGAVTFYIDSAKRVAINTPTVVDSALTINGGINANGIRVLPYNAGAGYAGGITIRESDNGNDALYLGANTGNSQVLLKSGGTIMSAFYSYADCYLNGNASNQKFGIGDATPDSQLQVNLGGHFGRGLKVDGLMVIDTAVAYTGAELTLDGDMYASGDVSALTFTDRTPFYEGDALKEVMKIKGKDGEIDHSTLPKFAQSEKGGRDLGGMISVLTVAIQQLKAENDSLKIEINKLKK